jgi:hypothetical protein
VAAPGLEPKIAQQLESRYPGIKPERVVSAPGGFIVEGGNGKVHTTAIGAMQDLVAEYRKNPPAPEGKEEGQQGLEPPPSALERAKPAPTAKAPAATIQLSTRGDVVHAVRWPKGQKAAPTLPAQGEVSKQPSAIEYDAITKHIAEVVKTPTYRADTHEGSLLRDQVRAWEQEQAFHKPAAIARAEREIEAERAAREKKEPAPTSLEEPKPAPPAPQATSFTARMDAAQTADEGRAILGDATDAIEALMRDIGIKPIVGNVAPNYTVGIHILNDKKRVRPALKEAKAKNPAKAKQLEALIQDVLQAYGPGWERVKDLDRVREDAKFEKFKAEQPPKKGKGKGKTTQVAAPSTEVVKVQPGEVTSPEPKPTRLTGGEAVAPFIEDISQEPDWYQTTFKAELPPSFKTELPPWSQVVQLAQLRKFTGQTLREIADTAAWLHQERVLAEREKFQVEQERGKPVTYEQDRDAREAKKKAAAADKLAAKKKTERDEKEKEKEAEAKKAKAEGPFPKLPPALADDQTGYGWLDLDFESDLDRALYIAAGGNPTTPPRDVKSGRQRQHLEFAMTHTGMSEQEAEVAGHAIRDTIFFLSKGLAREGKDQPRTMLRVPAQVAAKAPVAAAPAAAPKKGKGKVVAMPAKEEQPGKVTSPEQEAKAVESLEDEHGIKVEPVKRNAKIEAEVLKDIGRGRDAHELSNSPAWTKRRAEYMEAITALQQDGLIDYDLTSSEWRPTKKAKEAAKPKPRPKPKASILQDDEPGKPSSPEGRDYDDIQRDIDAEEDRLVAGGMSEQQVIRLYDPSVNEAKDFPPGWQPMPEKLAALYRERDAVWESEERREAREAREAEEAEDRKRETKSRETAAATEAVIQRLRAAVRRLEAVTRLKTVAEHAGAFEDLKNAREALKRATTGAGLLPGPGKVTSPEKKSAFDRAKDALAGFVGKKKTDVKQAGLMDPDTHPGGSVYANRGNSWMIEHAKIRFPKGKNIGVVYANHDGMRIFMWIAGRALGGANFGASDYNIILGDLEKHLGLRLSPEANAVLDKLHADITEFRKQNPEGMDVVLADKKRPLFVNKERKATLSTKTVAYEERLHAAQRKAPLKEKAIHDLMKTALFKKAWTYLVHEQLYEFDVLENFDEITAKILAGQDMGLTLDERVEIAQAYRAALIAEHGEDVIVLFRYMKAGAVKEAFRGRETKAEKDSGRTGVEPERGGELQRGPTGGREGEAPGPGRERGVREGPEGAVEEGRGEGEGRLDLKASRAQPATEITDKTFVKDTARTLLGEWSAGRIKVKDIAAKIIKEHGAKARQIGEQVAALVQDWIRKPIRHHIKEVSTAQPFGPNKLADPDKDLVVTGVHNARQDPVFVEKSVGLMLKYVDFKDIKGLTPNAAVEKIIGRLVDNLLWLHDKYVDLGFAERARLWYDGGRKKVVANAKQYGTTIEQAAGVLAGFSPQKDWFQNVDMARRFHEWWNQRHELKWTPEMEAIYENKILPDKEDGDRKTIRKRERKYQKDRAEYPGKIAEWKAKIAEARRNKVPVQDRPKKPKRPKRKPFTPTTTLQENYAAMKGKAAIEVTDVPSMAIWFRMWDEAHNKRDYRVLTPEGAWGDVMMVEEKDGSLRPAEMAWSGYEYMEKAIRIMQDGSINNISDQLGDRHKVRNFYNNLLDPNSPNGHITCDTHAVCAGLLRPLGGSAVEVNHNLGNGVQSRKIGELGTYWIFAEAYRRAARQRQILPREMQSITWEATRGLFTGKKSEAYNNWASALWGKVSDGKLTAKEARKQLYAHFKGIDPPAWSAEGRAISRAGSDEEEGGAADEAAVSESRPVGDERPGSGRAPGGRRGTGAAGGVPSSGLPVGRGRRGRIGKASLLLDDAPSDFDADSLNASLTDPALQADKPIEDDAQLVESLGKMKFAFRPPAQPGKRHRERYASGTVYMNSAASNVLAKMFKFNGLDGVNVVQPNVQFMLDMYKWYDTNVPGIDADARWAMTQINHELTKWLRTAQADDSLQFVKVDDRQTKKFKRVKRATGREEKIHGAQAKAPLSTKVMDDLLATPVFKKLLDVLMNETHGAYDYLKGLTPDEMIKGQFKEITAKVLASNPFGHGLINLDDRIEVAIAYREALIEAHGKDVVLLFRYVHASPVKEAFRATKPVSTLAQTMASFRAEADRRKAAGEIPGGPLPSAVSPQPQQQQQSQAAPVAPQQTDASSVPVSPLFEQHREIQKEARKPIDKTRLQKFTEAWDNIKHALTRQFMHLEGGAKYAELKQFLNRVSKSKGTTIHRAAQAIIDQLEKLDDTEYTHFLETVAYNDLVARVMEDTKRSGTAIDPKDLPWKIKSKAHLFALRKEAHDRAMANPKIVEALNKREAIWKTVKAEYIAAMAKMGYDVSKTVSRKDYFRHRVLKHEELKDAIGQPGTGAGQRYKLPTGRSWLKMSSVNVNEYSLDYIGSEFEVLHQMMYDTVRAEFLGWLKDKSGHNQSRAIRRQAAAANKATIMPHFDAMARNHNRQNPGTKKLDGEAMYRRVMNTKQAIAISKLQKLASGLKVPPKLQWVVDRLGRGQASIPDLMPLAAWLVADGKDVAAAEAAGLLLKGVADKRRLTKLMAGKKYIGTMKKAYNNLKGPGGVPWIKTHEMYKADQRDHFFFATTITDEAAKAIERDGSGEVLAAETKKQRVRGAEREQMILPREVIETLKEFMQPPSNKLLRGIDQIAHKPLSWWKTAKLIHPGSVIKYNLRNLSGDLEAVVTILPGALKHVGLSSKEIYEFMRTGRMPSQQFADWWSRGGMDANLQVHEMGDVNRLKKLSHLLISPETGIAGKGADLAVDAWEKVWGSTRAMTDYREGILRYATYIEFQKQIEASADGRPTTFAKSLRTEVMALRDKKDRAYKLSNDLMLAYDEVTAAGQWTRRNLIPFWSFQEKNAQGYWRLIKNAFEDGRTAAGIGYAALGGGSLALRTGVWTAIKIGRTVTTALALKTLTELFNHMFWPDEEEDLPESVRKSSHIVLGRDENGKVRVFSRLGLIDDVLEWGGLDASPYYVREYMNGRMTIEEMAWEMAKAGPNKLAQSITPYVKTTAELTSGKTWFPDFFNKREIRDRWEYLAREVGMVWPYHKFFSGKPQPPLSMEKVMDFIVYRYDANETQYNSFRYDRVPKYGLQNDIDISGGSPGGMSMKHAAAALYDIRMGLRYDDQNAVAAGMQEYVEAGGTRQNLMKSIDRLHPLGALSKAERQEYEDSLSPKDAAQLAKAVQYWEEHFNSKIDDLLDAAAEAELPGKKRRK